MVLFKLISEIVLFDYFVIEFTSSVFNKSYKLLSFAAFISTVSDLGSGLVNLMTKSTKTNQNHMYNKFTLTDTQAKAFNTNQNHMYNKFTLIDTQAKAFNTLIWIPLWHSIPFTSLPLLSLFILTRHRRI